MRGGGGGGRKYFKGAGKILALFSGSKGALTPWEGLTCHFHKKIHMSSLLWHTRFSYLTVY